MRHTSSSSAEECRQRYCTALHVDTNQGGSYRVATVLLYLHEIEGAVHHAACSLQSVSCSLQPLSLPPRSSHPTPPLSPSGGVGGETRFPLVGAPTDSDLRDAAERLAGLGVTAFSPDEAVEWPPIAPRKLLLEAAEAGDGVGLHIRPRRGLAAVFWTHTTDGLDPYSWHAGARLPPEATDGKLIAQKFKSLPVELRPKRRADKVRLPAEMAPPPLR